MSKFFSIAKALAVMGTSAAITFACLYMQRPQNIVDWVALIGFVVMANALLWHPRETMRFVGRAISR